MTKFTAFVMALGIVLGWFTDDLPTCSDVDNVMLAQGAEIVPYDLNGHLFVGLPSKAELDMSAYYGIARFSDADGGGIWIQKHPATHDDYVWWFLNYDGVGGAHNSCGPYRFSH